MTTPKNQVKTNTLSEEHHRILCQSVLTARKEGWDVLENLIQERDEDLDYLDSFGKTVLHYAIRANAPLKIIQRLIQRGLDPNKGDVDGWTCLHLFIRLHSNLDESILSLLINSGANVNLKNNVGETALFFAVKYECPISIVTTLLLAGADPNIVNQEGETPLIEIAKNQSKFNFLCHVKELLKYGANPYLRDRTGQNSLDWGRRYDKQDIVKIMRMVRYENAAKKENTIV